MMQIRHGDWVRLAATWDTIAAGASVVQTIQLEKRAGFVVLAESFDAVLGEDLANFRIGTPLLRDVSSLPTTATGTDRELPSIQSLELALEINGLQSQPLPVMASHIGRTGLKVVPVRFGANQLLQISLRNRSLRAVRAQYVIEGYYTDTQLPR